MNLRAALRQARIRYQTKATNPDEIILNCPFCVSRHESPDTRFRCAVNVAKNAGNCLNCGWAVNEGAIEAVVAMLQLDTGREVRKWLDDAPETPEPRPGQKVEHGPPEGFFALGMLYLDELRECDPALVAIQYLQQRGFTWEQIVDQQIGMCLRERYAFRIIFPIMALVWDAATQKQTKPAWDGFVARTIANAEPKYLNSAGPKPLYVAGPFLNKDQMKKQSSMIVLSEGVIKAHAIYSAFDHLSNWYSAALLGHTISDRQREELPSHRGILIFPDPDVAGLQGALKVARELSAQNEVLFPQILPVKQADEHSRNEIDKIIMSLEMFTPFVELKIAKRIAEIRR
jgi:hypothetical protein